MNWTGGALNRKKPRGCVTSQKQYFAKARARTSSCKAPLRPLLSQSPFHEVLAVVDDAPTKRSTQETCRTTQQTEDLFGGPTNQSTNQHPLVVGLKHRLLKEIDCAAVSAVRPLEINFPAVEERFGKRRRLTETDRKRLAIPGSRSHIKPTTVRRPAHSPKPPQTMTHMLDDRNPAYKQLQSSQLMLLDSDGKASGDDGARKKTPLIHESDTSKHCQGTASSDSSPLLLEVHRSSSTPEPELGSPSPTHLSGSSPVHQNRSANDSNSHSSSQRELTPSQPCSTIGDKVHDSDRSSDHSNRRRSSLQQQEMPLSQRRFTVDDQILAEKENTLAAGPIRSFTGTVPVSAAASSQHSSFQQETTPSQRCFTIGDKAHHDSDRSVYHSNRQRSFIQRQEMRPSQRRFTIDDQVEAERRAVLSQHPHSSSGGPAPTIPTTDRLALPPRNGSSQIISRFTAAADRSPSDNHPWLLMPRTTWMMNSPNNPPLLRYPGQSTSPCPDGTIDATRHSARIYGQSISPRDDFIKSTQSRPSNSSQARWPDTGGRAIEHRSSLQDPRSSLDETDGPRSFRLAAAAAGQSAFRGPGISRHDEPELPNLPGKDTSSPVVFGQRLTLAN